MNFTNELWKFARGDDKGTAFEEWLYKQDELEVFLGD
tara:strand:- start:1371 stop:1481 length:111 start_codon:yes stop_codon:yes gene_type:complete